MLGNVLLVCLLLVRLVSAIDGYTIPPGSPGYQHGDSSQAVQFDSRSLFVDGQRVFLFGGEFHPWRLPVPELWSDILQKMKAAGHNSVSIYVSWGLTEGKPGTLDWNHYRSIETFYQIAARVGIYVVARPGPYINAETTGGGLPGWLTNVRGVARSNSSDYIDSWKNYIREFSEITSRYQYPDGPVIAVQSENEFYRDRAAVPTSTEYMVILEEALRAGGITKVPLSCNDVYPSGNFASGKGQVDLYGFDSYPNGFNCSNPSQWSELASHYIPAHSNVAPWTVMFFPEFQGGALDGWGGVGYAGCRELTGPDFVNVFYKNNVASGSKAMSFYMTYGGTNWGNIAYPGVYTSYDYGAAIQESRILATTKYDEIKLQGLFYHASPSLLSSAILASGVQAPFSDNSGIFTTHMGDSADPGSPNYYIVRQISNNYTTSISFHLTVNTTTGPVTIPQFGSSLTLNGHESKILVSEYPFGANSTLIYSTAEVMTHLVVDATDVLVLYVSPDQSIEAVIKGSTSSKPPRITGSSSVTARQGDGIMIITGQPRGITVISFDDKKIIVADKKALDKVWNPRLSSTYDISPAKASVLVIGPYLLRNATVEGSTIHLVGDTTVDKSTELTIVAPSRVNLATWNGQAIPLRNNSLKLGLSAKIPKGVKHGGLTLPDLASLEWKAADSLPEIRKDFNDSAWVVADKTTTFRPSKPFEGKLVLYADEYGFHSGNFLYRGYFTGGATGVRLSMQGGSNFGFSVFLNGKFVGSGQGFEGADVVNSTFTFPSGLVAESNVLTVLTDSTGLNEDWNADDEFKDPRGVRGYALLGGGDFDRWTLTGNLGGENYPDKVRGPYNEGGLWAERSGSVLPGFDDSSWESSSPLTGIDTAGVQVYRTKFDLNVPQGLDATLAFKFTTTRKKNYRCVLYVNGWQFGRFVSNFGPQTTFPVPEGILNHKGSNEIALTLWSLDPKGAHIKNFELVSLGAFVSGKEVVSSGTVTSPSFSELR